MLYHRRLHLFTTCHTAIRVWAPFLLQPLQCVGSPHPFKVFVFSFFVLFRFLFCCYLLKQYESLCACFELLHWENSCMILFIKSTIFLHDDFESPTNTSPRGGGIIFYFPSPHLHSNFAQDGRISRWSQTSLFFATRLDTMS